MTKRKESIEYTLYGDLDGMSVARLRAMLENYPDDARIDVRTERVYALYDWSDETRDSFVFTWNE